MSELCIFAGTSEGRRLVETLSGRGVHIVVCVATEYGEVVLGEHPDVEVHAGAMPPEEIRALLTERRFLLLVDATHPYAEHITQSLREACEACQTEYLRLERGSTAAEADGVFVGDTAACIAWLKQTNGNILLTTGSKSLPQFCADEALRERIYARVLPVTESIKICADAGLPTSRILAMQGPFERTMNAAMLRACGAKILVTKDSGEAGGYEEKIAAARELGVQTVIIGRPQKPEGADFDSVLRTVRERLGLPEDKTVTLAGIGPGDDNSRTLALSKAVAAADCLIGAGRMLAGFDAAGKTVLEATNSQQIADYIRQSPCRNILVLFSGDVGFYSGASALRALLGDMDIRLLPGIGSLSYFCAKIGRRWDDVRAVSRHGRDCDLRREIAGHTAVFTLLGGDNAAAAELKRLADGGFGSCRAWTGENLSYPDERILAGTVEELSRERFGSLCVLLVENPDAAHRPVSAGWPDEDFVRGAVPMTKSEVRCVTLSKLALRADSVLWDVGAGTGSVSAECSRLLVGGAVYAVERAHEGAELIRRNAEKFALSNITVIEGEAPDALAELPAPSHVFIGGSGGCLREIVRTALLKNPAVRIVSNAVTAETAAELTALGRKFEYFEMTELNISRSRAVGSYHMMSAQNPVSIFVMSNAEKGKDYVQTE